MDECIFCRIVQKTVPSDIVYEDEDFLVFPDIRPKAPIHLLIMPKKHIVSLMDVNQEDNELVKELLLIAKKVAEEKNIKGYKLQMNVGKDGGQEIDHIHLHLLAQ